MRKRALIIIGIVIVLIAIVVLILISFIKNSSSNDIKNESGKEDSSVKVINMQWSDDYNNTNLEEDSEIDTLIINGNGTSWTNLYIKTNAKN